MSELNSTSDQQVAADIQSGKLSDVVFAAGFGGGLATIDDGPWFSEEDGHCAEEIGSMYDIERYDYDQ